MVTLFIAYRKDSEPWRDRIKAELEKLALIDNGRAYPIAVWSDDHLLGGDFWEDRIATAIDACELFLLLVSSDLNGGYALEVELRRAIGRARRNERCKIVPIVIDNVLAFLGSAGLEEFRFHAIPAGGRGVSQKPFSGDIDAWLEAVVTGLKRVIERELGAGQWRTFDTTKLAHAVLDAAYEATCVATEEAKVFPGWSKVAFAADRANDLVRSGAPSLLTSVSTIKRLASESRREAKAAGASNTEAALLRFGAALDDLYDSAVADGFDVPEVGSATDIPSSHPSIRRDLDSLGQFLERTEQSAESLAATHVDDGARSFVIDASQQIGAEARLAKAAASAEVVEPAVLLGATAELSGTIDSVSEHANAICLPEASMSHIRDAKRTANKARQTARRIQKRSSELVTGDGESGSAAKIPPPSPREIAKVFATQSYRVFSTTYDELVAAEDLVEEEELNRLFEYLENNMRQWRLPGWNTRLERAVLRQASDTALTLLVDNSGSMRGRPIHLTSKLLLRCGHFLDACGVDFEILGFTTRAWKGGLAKEEWLSAGRPDSPGRLNDLRHVVYKSFDAKWSTSARNLGLMMREGLLKENIDGEALVWSAGRLDRMPNPRKVIIVLSDGAPVDDSTLSVMPKDYLERHLRFVVDRIQHQTGMELHALGIGHNPSRYYPNSRYSREGASDEALCRTFDRVLLDVFVDRELR